MPRGNLARVEIGRDRRRATLGIREGHVAVWSHEIDGVAAQTGATNLRTPGKDVQRQVSIITQSFHLGCSLTVHVDLPVQRGQRRKVVDAVLA
jgi:hypothetical protein